MYSYVSINRGPGSSVGIATGYGLDVPGIESRWGGEIFSNCPDRPWGPPNLLYNGYRVFPRGKERPVRDADPSPPSSTVGYERVELYLYSSYGPYGLYRASVPVQGWPLHLLNYKSVIWHILPKIFASLHVHPLFVLRSAQNAMTL